MSFGVINENLYPIIVSVSILTTFVTPYMIKSALPFYDWLEPRLPARLKKHLSQYSEHANGDSTDRPRLRLFIRKQLTNILLYGVILAAISLLSLTILKPFLDRLFTDLEIPLIWSRIIGLAATLVIMSPFLWAVAVKNVSKKKIREMFDNYRFSQAVVIPLLVLRYFAALLSVGVVVAGYVDLAAGFLMVIAVIIVAVVLFSRKADGFYSQIEEQFTKNFTEGERQFNY